jgi:flagellar biosynthetic protein FliQ
VSHALIVDLARNAIMMALLVAGPMLIVALGVGLIISVIQAVTQIQEQTLSFLPKLLAVAAVFLIALPWMLQLLVKYTTATVRLPAFETVPFHVDVRDKLPQRVPSFLHGRPRDGSAN